MIGRFDPLSDLLRGFIRRPRIRGFSIEAAETDRSEVARLVGGFEHHADNRAPFFSVSLADCTCAGSAWKDALRSVQDTHAELRSAGSPVGSMPPQPVGEEPAASVSVVLAGIASRVESPAEGVLLCLQLRGVIEPPMLSQLGTMIRSRELEGVRFVVVAEPDAKSSLENWAKRLGEDRMWFYRLDPAPAARAGQTIQALDAEERNGPGFRGAWPTGIKPPPRPRRRRGPPARALPASGDAPTDGALREAADTPDEEAEFEHQLSLLVRRAEAEMQQEHGPDALRYQTQARELCTEHEQHRRAIEMEMMLGGYLLRLDQPRLAASTFSRADEAGFEHQEYELAAKAQVNEGIAYERDLDTVAALKAYRRAIETGKGVADAPAVVFEAYRRAGEVALREGLDVDCIGLWGDAVAYGRDLEAERRGDAVKELARRLSELLVRHRRYSQAREIDRLAEEF